MRAMVRALVLAVMAAGCATVETTPSASVTTLMPDSERWFKLSWEAVPEKNGDQRRLRGYVVNTYGEAAARVQLLARRSTARAPSWVSASNGSRASCPAS